MMEHINQLLAWQAQLDENPNAIYANVDVAKRLLRHGIEALEEISSADRKAREECCEIIKSLKISGECAFDSEREYNRALDDVFQVIRHSAQMWK